MKKVKKSLCAVLAALLLLGALAGCGSPSWESPTEETPVPTAAVPAEDEPKDAAPAPGEESSGDDGAEAEPVPEDVEPAEEEPEDAAPASGGEESSDTGDDGSLSVAEHTGDTFTSDMFGMSYTIGEDWRFIEGEQFENLKDSLGLISGAINSNGSNILVVTYTTDEYYAMGGELVAEDYFQYRERRDDFLKNNGLSEDTKVSSEMFTISGDDYDGLLFETTASNGTPSYSISMYRVYYDYDMDVTNVMNIFMTSLSKDELYQMLDMLTFQPEEY